MVRAGMPVIFRLRRPMVFAKGYNKRADVSSEDVLPGRLVADREVIWSFS